MLSNPLVSRCSAPRMSKSVGLSSKSQTSLAMSVSLAEITITEDVGVMRPPINLHWDKVSAQVRRTKMIGRQQIALDVGLVSIHTPAASWHGD